MSWFELNEGILQYSENKLVLENGKDKERKEKKSNKKSKEMRRKEKME